MEIVWDAASGAGRVPALEVSEGRWQVIALPAGTSGETETDDV